MTKKQPVRRGASPAARPTEWTSAVVLLASALLLFSQDRNVAALVATAGACVPAIATGLFAWYESRHADTTVTTPAITE